MSNSNNGIYNNNYNGNNNQNLAAEGVMERGRFVSIVDKMNKMHIVVVPRQERKNVYKYNEFGMC